MWEELKKFMFARIFYTFVCDKSTCITSANRVYAKDLDFESFMTFSDLR